MACGVLDLLDLIVLTWPKNLCIIVATTASFFTFFLVV
jgi:hypothetical protein